MTSLHKRRWWVVLLCLAILAFAIASAAAGVVFDGVLVFLGALFALAPLVLVRRSASAPEPIESFIATRAWRGPPRTISLL